MNQHLKNKYGDEQVFIVPTCKVTNIEDKFNYTKELNINKLMQYGKFVLRYEAEGYGAMQQIIPYILIYCKDTKRFFVSTRTSNSGEQRLYDKISIGFGGHINPCDFDNDSNNLITNCLLRELNEEVDIDMKNTDCKLIGTIRNITSELNDHLGLVYLLTVKEEVAAIKETDKLIGEWMTMQDLVKHYIKLEDWAKFIVDYIHNNNTILD